MPRLTAIFTATLLTLAPLGAAFAAPTDDAPLKRLHTAYALYDLGLSDGAPLYLLAAAQLRKSVALAPTSRAPMGGVAEDGEPLTWHQMLDTAGPMIADDPTLQGLALDIRAAKTKGIKSGPVYSIVTIKGRGRDSYPNLTFAGGKYAEIYVEGASGTDLNLMVHDARKRLVCSDTDISAVAYCGWHPTADTTYSVTVENAAGRGGRYSLMSN